MIIFCIIFTILLFVVTLKDCIKGKVKYKVPYFCMVLGVFLIAQSICIFSLSTQIDRRVAQDTKVEKVSSVGEMNSKVSVTGASVNFLHNEQSPQIVSNYNSQQVAKPQDTKVKDEDNRKVEPTAEPSVVNFVRANSVKMAQKLIARDKCVYSLSLDLIKEFDAKYLSNTNYSCLGYIMDDKYIFHNKATIDLMIAENQRLEKLNTDSFIRSKLDELEENLWGTKEKISLKVLSKLEKYMIKTFSYDSKYKTGERTKWSKYQDVNGANVYYLLKTNKGVCADFVELYRLVCKDLGIDCKVEYGGTTDEDTRCHAWNIVTIDDIVYYKDITWDIQNKKRVWCDNRKTSVEYFLRSHHMMCSYD